MAKTTAPLGERDANIQTATPKHGKTGPYAKPGAGSKKRKSGPEENEGKLDKTKPKKSKTEKQNDLDVSEIKLDGEDTDSVPIYLTCDDIRRQINDHLKKTSATRASFCRAVEGMYTNPPSEGLSTRALTTFLSGKGPAWGASRPFFYGAWVYFEKLRIKQGKKKSKKQQEMEAAWGSKGMDRHEQNAGIICFPGEGRPHIDRLGRLEIDGKYV